VNADVVIIGGGAAGYFAAANLNRSDEPRKIVLIESGNRPLTKVRISGGGRCNVTYHELDIQRLSQNYPRGGRELIGAFSRFQPGDMIDWLNDRGVPTKVEPDGRVFPLSDDSGTIVRCLQTGAQQRGVSVITGKKVRRIQPGDESFQVVYADGESIQSKFVLLATGSHPSGHRLAKELGHHIVPSVPSLFTFNINDPRLKDLAGVSFPKIRIRFNLGGKTFEQEGALLITHWGLSGPAILKSSAWAARELSDAGYQGKLTLDFASTESEEQVRNLILQLLRDNPKKDLSRLPVPWVPKRYWKQLIQELFGEGLRCSEVSRKAVDLITGEIRRAEFEYEGKSTNKDEFVTAGGVELRDIDFRTMESRIQPRLFFAGEILDIDGVTGGFNFQNAWTTAYLCASAINSRLSC
jgi:predicted Rossmann fold flavoprotein